MEDVASGGTHDVRLAPAPRGVVVVEDVVGAASAEKKSLSRFSNKVNVKTFYSVESDAGQSLTR